MSDKFQSVIIKLIDGTVHKFTGPAHKSIREGNGILDIKFTAPKTLPKGHYFEEINKAVPAE